MLYSSLEWGDWVALPLTRFVTCYFPSFTTIRSLYTDLLRSTSPITRLSTVWLKISVSKCENARNAITLLLHLVKILSYQPCCAQNNPKNTAVRCLAKIVMENHILTHWHRLTPDGKMYIIQNNYMCVWWLTSALPPSVGWRQSSCLLQSLLISCKNRTTRAWPGPSSSISYYRSACRRLWRPAGAWAGLSEFSPVDSFTGLNYCKAVGGLFNVCISTEKVLLSILLYSANYNHIMSSFVIFKDLWQF